MSKARRQDSQAPRRLVNQEFELLSELRPKAHKHGSKCTWPKAFSAKRQGFNPVVTHGGGSDQSRGPAIHHGVQPVDQLLPGLRLSVEPAAGGGVFP